MSFVEVKQKKKEILKKENKIFSKQFVTTELTKYDLRKQTFLMDVFRWTRKRNVEKRKENIL